MAKDTLRLKIDGGGVVHALQDALGKLGSDLGEVVLDFSSVHRVDSGALKAMEDFAITLNGNASKVVLRGVNIDVYRVLKLMKLATRFSFRA